MEDTIITSEEAQELRMRLAAYERQQAEVAAIAANAVHAKLKQVVECDQFAEVHHLLVQAMAGSSDTFFNIHANALIEIMPRLVETVANYVPYVPAPVVPVLPVVTPPVEDQTGGE